MSNSRDTNGTRFGTISCTSNSPTSIVTGKPTWNTPICGAARFRIPSARFAIKSAATTGSASSSPIPNTVAPNGDPLLVIAAREKSDKVAAALASAPNVDLEKEDKAGENALMLASLNGDLGLVKLLIDKGAEVSKKGWAPLHYAATNGQDAVVKVLLDHDAYIDTASPNGTTPLMMAARGNHASTVTLLLDQGADPQVKNQLGITALEFAKHYNAPDAIEILSKRTTRIGAATPADAQKSAK